MVNRKSRVSHRRKTHKKHRHKKHRGKTGKKMMRKVKKLTRTVKKTGMRTIKDTTGLGMKFLRVGSRVPKQMIHDSKLLGKKFRRKFNKTRKNISSKFLVGGAFGADGHAAFGFSDTGNPTKDGQKDSGRGKKNSERYKNDPEYKKAHDKAADDKSSNDK